MQTLGWTSLRARHLTGRGRVSRVRGHCEIFQCRSAGRHEQSNRRLAAPQCVAHPFAARLSVEFLAAGSMQAGTHDTPAFQIACVCSCSEHHPATRARPTLSKRHEPATPDTLLAPSLSPPLEPKNACGPSATEPEDRIFRTHPKRATYARVARAMVRDLEAKDDYAPPPSAAGHLKIP